MKLYKQHNGKTWSMRFVFEGRRIERSTGYTNKRKAEAYAEAFRTKLRNEGVGFLEKRDYPTFKQAIADFLEWSAFKAKEEHDHTLQNSVENVDRSFREHSR